MRKSIKINWLKTLGLAFLLTINLACEKDNINLSPIENNTVASQPQITLITLDELKQKIENYTNSEKLDSFLTSSFTDGGSFKSSTNDNSDTIIIDTNYINQVEDGDEVTYTARVINDIETQNLVIRENDDILEYVLLTYEFSDKLIVEDDNLTLGNLSIEPLNEIPLQKSSSQFCYAVNLGFPYPCGGLDINGNPANHYPGDSCTAGDQPGYLWFTTTVCIGGGGGGSFPISALGLPRECSALQCSNPMENTGGGGGGGGTVDPFGNDNNNNDGNIINVNSSPFTGANGESLFDIYVEGAVNLLDHELGGLGDLQKYWLRGNDRIMQEIIDFLHLNDWSDEVKEEAKMRIDAERAKGGWIIDPGTFPNRPALKYTHTFVPDPYGKMYLLENGLILLKSTVVRKINDSDFEQTIASTEVVTDGHNYIYNTDTKRWFEYRLPPPNIATADLDFLFNGFWTGLKIVGRYATPVEDIIILITGEDFDEVEQDRVRTAGFMIVGLIPGGKAFKPVAKLVNGVTKYRKIVKVTISGIEETVSLPIKIVNNVVDFGSQAYNNQQLRKILNITSSTTHAHHLIPFARKGHPLIQRAAKADKTFHISEGLNGIPRPNSLHLTGHRRYSNVVKGILDNNTHIVDEDEAFDFIEGLANHIRNLIENNQSFNSRQIADLITYPN
jgi:hypothetical protein